MVAKNKTVTRRHIDSLKPTTIQQFFIHSGHHHARLHGGTVIDLKPAHHPGEIKPAVTSWRVNGSIDHLKPTELDPDTVMETGGIHWEHVGGIDDKGRWNTTRFSHEGKLRPARFFPSKLYHLAPQIRILDARPEWLHDITVTDAIAEGMAAADGLLPDEDLAVHHAHEELFPQERLSQPSLPIARYAVLWDTLYPKTPWHTNPLAWRYAFTAL